MTNAGDKRIVQMQFDNKDFERNIKTSEKSLEKFKEYLDFSKCEKGLEKFSNATKNLTFDHLVDNVQKLTDKFTGLGDIGEMVISRIRHGIDSVVGKVTNLVHSLGFEQVTAGLDKFGKMNKNVQTIMAATGESQEVVYDILKRLNNYTDQTSYNFVDMAANIGKFTSVGIPLKKAEKQMEGIANWAARSGAGVAEASRAMYNLSQAMGVGALTKIDWKSIENAGMATKEFKEQLIEAGVASGNLVMEQGKDGKKIIKTASKFGKQVEVTYQNVAETLSKKWADTEVLGSTLERYYRENLDPDAVTKPVVEMTDDQLKEIKRRYEDFKLDKSDFEYLDKQGLATVELKQKAIEAAEKVGNLVKTTDKSGKTIYKTAAKYGKEIEVSIDNIASTLDIGWMDRSVGQQLGLLENLADASYAAAQKCTTLTDVFDAWRDQLSTGWMRAWEIVFGQLSESMELFSAICNKVSEGFSSFIETLVGGEEELEDGTIAMKRGILGIWAEIGGRDSLWSMFVGESDDLYEGAYGFLDVIQDIGRMISDAFWSLILVMHPDLAPDNESWLSNDQYRMEQLAFDLKDATDRVRAFVEGIKDFLHSAPEGQVKTRFQMIQDFVNGVFSTVAIVFNSIRDTFNFFKKLLGQEALGPILDDIISIFQVFGKELTETGKATSKGKGLKAFFDDLYKSLVESGLFDALRSISHVISDLIKSFFETNDGGSKTIAVWQGIASVLGKVAKVVAHVATPVIEFARKIITSIRNLASGKISFAQFAMQLKDSLRFMIDSIFNFTPFFTKKFGKFFDSIKKVFTSGFSKESIDNLKARFNEAFGGLKEKLPEGVKNTLKTIYNSIKTFATNLIEKIKGFFVPLFTDIKNVFSSGFSKDSVGQLKARFQAIFQSIVNALPDSLKGEHGIIEKAKKVVLDLWTKIKDKIKSVLGIQTSEDAKEVAEGVKGFDISKILSIILGGIGIGVAGKKIGEVTGLFGSISEIGDGITGSKKKGKGLLKYVGLLGLVVGGIAGITAIKPDTSENATIFDKVITWVQTGINKVKEFFSSLFGIGGKDDPKTQVKKYATDITTAGADEVDANKKNIFDRIIDWFKEKIGAVKAFIQKIAGNAKGDAASVITWFKSLDLSKLMLILVGALGIVGLVMIVKKVINIVKMFMGFLDAIKDLPKNINEALHGADKKVDAGEKLLKMAIAIGILVAAVVIIGNMELGEAIQGVAAVAILMAGLIVMTKMMTKEFKSVEDVNKLNSGIGMLIAMSASIFILVQALLPLSKLRWDQLGAMGSGLVACVASFWAVSKILKQAKFKMEYMIGLLAFAGAVWLLIQALMPMREILDPMDWARMFGALGVILFELFAYQWALKKFAGGGVADMIGIAALVASIAFLVNSLLPLTKLDFGKEIMKMLGFLFIVLLELAAFTIIVSNVSNGLSGSGLIQLAAVALSIGLLITALLPLTLLNKEQISNMVNTFEKIIIILGVFTLVVGIANRFGAGLKGSGLVNLIAVAGTIIILILAMLPLALMKPEQINQALIAVCSLIAMLGIFILMVNAIGGGLKGTAMVQLLAVAATIVVLVLAMIPLALMKPEQLQMALIAIGSLMIGLGIVMLALSQLKVGKSALTNLLMLAAIVAVIYVFSVALNSVKNIKAETISAFADGIVKLLVGMAIVMAVLSLIKDPTTLLATLVILIVGLAAVLVVAAALVPLVMNAIASGLENMMSKLVLISNMFGSFSDNMDDVSESGLEATKRKFQKLIDLMGIIRGCSSYLEDIKSFEMAMLMLGNAIGQFEFSTKDITSNLAEGNAMKFIEKVLSLKDDFNEFTIGNFADDLANLAEAVSSFAEASGETTNVEDINAKIGVIKDILALKDDFNGFSIGDFDSMLVNLGIAISSFGATSFVGGISASTGIGVVKDILGLKDDFSSFTLGDFNEQAVNLGEALKLFGGAVTEGGEGVGNGIKMIQDLAGQASNLDLISKLPMDTLKSQIAGLGGALSIYATGASQYGEVEGLNESDIPNVQKAVELLRTVVTSLAEDGGFSELPDLPDETNLGTFGAELAALAIAMKSFADASKDLDNTDKAIEVLGFLARLKYRLTADEVAATLVFKKQGVTKNILTNFGVQIAALGDGLKSFATSTQDFSVNDSVYSALTFLANLKTRLTGENVATALVFKNASITKYTLTNFGIQLEALGGSLKKFNDSTKDFKRNASVYWALTFLADLKTRLTDKEMETVKVFENASVSKSTLTDFGIQLASLGRSLGRFYDKTKNFKKNDSVYDALSFFADLKERLDVSVIEAVVFSVLGMTVDKNELTRFGTQIGELGDALGKFAENVNFDADKQKRFEEAISALDSFSKLANKLPVVGGISGLIHGNVQTIGGLAEDVVKIGGALAEFSKALVKDGIEFRSDLVSSALDSLMSFADIIMYLSDTVSEDGMHFRVGPIIAAEYIGEFLAALNQEVGAYETIENKAFVGENTKDSVIAQLVNMLVEFDEWFDIVDEESKGLKHLDAFQAFRDMAAGIASLVNVDPSVDFSVVGANIAAGVKQGITDGSSEVIEATIAMCEAAIKAAKETTKERSPSRVFREIGQFLSVGLANGIEKKRKEPIKSSINMIKDIIDETKEVADIQSPSRVFIEIGEFLMDGLTIGLENRSDIAIDAAAKIGLDTIDAMRDALGVHSPSTKAMAIAQNVAQGYLTGLISSERIIKAAKKKTRDMVLEDDITDAANESSAKPLSAYDVVSSIFGKNHILSLILRASEEIKPITDIASDAAGKMVERVSASIRKGLTEDDLALMKKLGLTEDEYLEIAEKMDGKRHRSKLVGIGSLIATMFGYNDGGYGLDVREHMIPWSESGLSVSEYCERIVAAEKKELEEGIARSKEIADRGREEFLNSKEYKDAQEAANGLMNAYLGTGEDGWLTRIIDPKAAGVIRGSNFVANNEQIINGMVNGMKFSTEMLAKQMLTLISIPAITASAFIPGIDPAEAEASINDMFTLIDNIYSKELADKIGSDEEGPVITPVVDLTNVEQGAHAIYDMFNGSDYGLRAGSNGIYLDPSRINRFASDSIPSDYTSPIEEVKKEVKNMRDDLTSLAGAMTKMKFVFNSGAVVAAIGPEMDQWLGQQGYYAVRSEIP